MNSGLMFHGHRSTMIIPVMIMLMDSCRRRCRHVCQTSHLLQTTRLKRYQISTATLMWIPMVNTTMICGMLQQRTGSGWLEKLSNNQPSNPRLILSNNLLIANSPHSLFNPLITVVNQLKTSMRKLICQRCSSMNRHHNMCPKRPCLTRASTCSNQTLTLQLLSHVPMLPLVCDLHGVHGYSNARRCLSLGQKAVSVKQPLLDSWRLPQHHTAIERC